MQWMTRIYEDEWSVAMQLTPAITKGLLSVLRGIKCEGGMQRRSCRAQGSRLAVLMKSNNHGLFRSSLSLSCSSLSSFDTASCLTVSSFAFCLSRSLCANLCDC